MSTDFWIKLILALLVFCAALAAVQLHKSELLRGFKAHLLRRKLLPQVARLPEVIVQSLNHSDQDLQTPVPPYELMRLRADLEALYDKAQPLFDQERNTFAELLTSLANLAAKMNKGQQQSVDVETSILLSQRFAQELKEIGL